jgi:3-phosphoshikimate 1-carboxyvinyltransferase
MAMSFAALALIYGTIKFDDADVVAKSYPDFWDDLSKLGFNTK